MHVSTAKDCDCSPALKTYMSEIKDEALLSAAEEHTLADAIAEGDCGARSRMIRGNLRLVIKIARTYCGRGLALDDLVAEGNLGLIRATKEYDPRFGTRFSTYACYWIKEAIGYALINTTALVRLPSHIVVLLTKWRKAERVLRLELGEDPGFDRVASQLGLTESQRSMVDKALQTLRVGSIGPTEENSGWEETAAMCLIPDTETELDAEDERREALRLLNRLDARERLVLSLLFGLGGEDRLTLKQTGVRVDVSRECIRKIEIRALAKLRAAWEEGTAGQGEPCPVSRPSQVARDVGRMSHR